jgi:hypothetical protein
MSSIYGARFPPDLASNIILRGDIRRLSQVLFCILDHNSSVQLNPPLDPVVDTVWRLFILCTFICTFNHMIKTQLVGRVLM